MLVFFEPDRRSENHAEIFRRERVFVWSGSDDLTRTQQEGMGEGGGDFLDVVGDENEGRGGPRGGETIHESEKITTRDRIEAGAGFIEDQQFGSRHQGSGDQDTLPFALGEILPFALGEMSGVDLLEQMKGDARIGFVAPLPEIELGKLTADDRIKGGFADGNQGAKRVGHDTNPQSELPPIAFAKFFTEEFDLPVGWSEIAGDGAQEGGFPRTIRPENHPMFSGLHGPVYPIENHGFVAAYKQIPDVEDRWSDGRHERMLAGVVRRGQAWLLSGGDDFDSQGWIADFRFTSGGKTNREGDATFFRGSFIEPGIADFCLSETFYCVGL